MGARTYKHLLVLCDTTDPNNSVNQTIAEYRMEEVINGAKYFMNITAVSNITFVFTEANYKLANRYYLTALAGESTNLEALAGYGQSSYYLGNIDDAKNTFWKMVEIDETNAFAWAYLGKLEAETPNYAKSLEYVLKAIQYESDYYDYWLDCGTYYHNLGNNLEAEKLGQKLSNSDLIISWAMFIVVDCMMNKKWWKKLTLIIKW
jgi:tetratricopeptide (TPR) repeat protein